MCETKKKEKKNAPQELNTQAQMAQKKVQHRPRVCLKIHLHRLVGADSVLKCTAVWSHL